MSFSKTEVSSRSIYVKETSAAIHLLYKSSERLNSPIQIFHRLCPDLRMISNKENLQTNEN